MHTTQSLLAFNELNTDSVQRNIKKFCDRCNSTSSVVELALDTVVSGNEKKHKDHFLFVLKIMQ